AVILTGTHSHINGNISNERLFDRDQITFPPLMQAAGYETALIGKYHLRTEPRGFDHYDMLINQGTYYNPQMIRNGSRVERVGYTTEIVTDLAIDWIEDGRDGDRPFMLMVQHKAPHRQWDPGPAQLTMFDGETLPEPPTLFDDFEGRSFAHSFSTMSVADHLTPADLHLTFPRWLLNDEQIALWERAYGPKNETFHAAKLHGDALVRWKYQRYAKDYLRCVAAIDDGVGQILDALDEQGLAENTVVVYSSDQGWYIGEHGWYDKRWMYEESFRTPLLVRWPGVTPAGSVSNAMVQNLDFAQTFLEIAGAAAPERMQGRSLVPVLRGETPDDWRESVYYRFYENRGPHAVPRHEGVATQRHKLINFYELGVYEMYDLVNDPDELRSVHDDPAYEDVRRDLERELARLRSQYGVTDETDREYDRHEDALDARRALRRLLGSRPGIWGRDIQPVSVERLDGYARETLTMRVDGRSIGMFAYTPPATDRLYPGVVLVHGTANEATTAHGKSSLDDQAANLARRGYVVLAMDRLGHESRSLRDGSETIEGVSDAFVADGTSLLGVTLSELQTAQRYLMRRPDVHEKRIAAVGDGTGGMLAQMLGFIEEDIAVVAAIDGAASFNAAHHDGSARRLPPIARVHGIRNWGGLPVALSGIYPRPQLDVHVSARAEPLHERAEERYRLGGHTEKHAAEMSLGETGDAWARVTAWLDRWLVDAFAGEPTPTR
ncbi:MAG: sulfatase/phosphatase domain-containing protein, partial [Planctomycetota bacterium]